MRSTVVSAAVAAFLVIAVLGMSAGPEVVMAQRVAPSHGSTSGLITLTTPVGEKLEQLTVIDPELHVMSVYHIELASGEISLKSVRNIHWDLQMLEFNGKTPLPNEIRNMLGQK